MMSVIFFLEVSEVCVCGWVYFLKKHLFRSFSGHAKIIFSLMQPLFRLQGSLRIIIVSITLDFSTKVKKFTRIKMLNKNTRIVLGDRDVAGTLYFTFTTMFWKDWKKKTFGWVKTSKTQAISKAFPYLACIYKKTWQKRNWFKSFSFCSSKKLFYWHDVSVSFSI